MKRLNVALTHHDSLFRFIVVDKDTADESEEFYNEVLSEVEADGYTRIDDPIAEVVDEVLIAIENAMREIGMPGISPSLFFLEPRQ